MSNIKKKSSSDQISRQLLKRLESGGYLGRIVPVNKLEDLQADLERHRKAGDLDREFDEERLAHFDFDVASRETHVRSIIIVAAPQPHVRFRLEWEGQEVPVVIPPTYSSRVDGRVERILREVLSAGGYDLFRRPIPLKPLAVRSGLAKYGKNNIAYVDGLGSYCRLMAFYTDMPIEDYTWSELSVMDQCRQCSACLKKCPTGAIMADRFLIRAEQCLTYLNESEHPLPGWVDPAWHHCVVGCLYCQTYCPVNRLLNVEVVEGPCLDSHETGLLLRGTAKEKLAESTRQILDEYGLTEWLRELARNLNAVLEVPDNLGRGLSLLPNRQDKGVSNGSE